MKNLTTILFFTFFLCGTKAVHGQLSITHPSNVQALAQQLVGEGIIISNVSFTGNPLMAGSFMNSGGTNIGIDSGIVLTTGLARSGRFSPIGLNGDGIAMAESIEASNAWALAGDNDLAAAINTNVADLFDACILEFDFIPLGDSLKFNYVFSSEEYTPLYVCSFNDAFAFFISGPGITGLKNIALIPNTNTPVSIFSVNDVPGGACPNNISYYKDNRSNIYFTHDGHTTILTAREKVVPCQTYHLKLVISDVSDDNLDSGVFLEAKSLTSNAVELAAITQTDPSTNENYLAEGCASGMFTVKRQRADPAPLVVRLSYGGTTVNGSDIQLLPISITIPANSDIANVTIVPLSDGIPEGIETLKIYSYNGCNADLPTDSSIIQIRDYDLLDVSPDSISICRNSSTQLHATAGFGSYQWSGGSLSDNTSPDPVAKPIRAITNYICTASSGTCKARDSSLVKWIVPVAKIFAGNDTVSILNQPIQLKATDVNNAGFITYTWFPSSYLSDAGSPEPVATLSQDFHYMVTGTTADGCVTQDDIFIKAYKGPEIYVPTAFTPNNNGLNDLLIPTAVGIHDFHFFRIYSRWGQLVFSTTDPRRGWDGTINGKIQSTGTYTWIAEGVDYKGSPVIRKGVVTIIR